MREQHQHVKAKDGIKDLMTPSESVYEVDKELFHSLDMDVTNEHEAHKKPHKKQTFKRRGNKNRN